MAYVLVDNFSGGVDRTRPRYVGPPGSLWSGINGHLTRGGDFEKRKAFAQYASLPPNTVGLAKVSTGLYVFGSAAAPAMPAGVTYMRLQHPTDAAQVMVGLNSWDLFAGKIYAIARYGNGDLRHFYDGVNVADWGAGGNKPTGFGSIARTHRRKLYSPIASVLEFSALDTANDFDSTHPGAGFVNMSTHHSGSDTVTGLGTFNDLLAVLSRRVIQLWSMVDDDANNVPVQFLPETGTRAPRSVIGFGDIDCVYLSDSGIRSLRSRSTTGLAGVNDIGTPIDTLVREWIMTLTDTDVQNAIGLVEPIDSRLWMVIGGRVFVFSYFPSKKISAWSWYEPGFQISDMVTLNDRLYCRSGDTIYIYGGADNNTYDTSRVTAELPFLSGGKPGTFKQVKGIDTAATGTWDCQILVNPNNENEYVEAGELVGVTWAEEGVAVPAHCTHIAPRLIHQADGYASLSQVGVYTDGAEVKL